MTLEHAPLVAIGVFVAYTALVATLWRINHVDYARIAESRERVVRGIVVPIGLGALLLAGATTLLGWWSPVLFQDGRTGPAWVLVVPLLLAVVGVIGALDVDYRGPKAEILPWLALGVLAVGFAEETLTRGILIVGGRQGGWSEPVVVVVSSVLFGLLHGINALFGQSGRATVAQMVMATLMGLAFYSTRMSTGTLIACMLLHALWDFSVLGQVATDRTPRSYTGPLAVLVYALGLAATVVIVRAG